MKRLFILLVLIGAYSKSKAQLEEDVVYFDQFYAIGWISDFNDTIITHSSLDDVPENQKYSLVFLKPDGSYQLMNWDFKKEFEPPILFKEQLKVNLQRRMITFSIGGRKKRYNILRENGQVILISRIEKVNTPWD